MSTVSAHLSDMALLEELRTRPGLIPINIDADNQQLVWADMEACHFYEGFFHKSLNTWSSLKGKKLVSFATGTEILENGSIVTDPILPSGFIFHAGRCGSTLLAKTLARSRENLVLSEAGPLNQIWLAFTGNGKQPLVEGEKYLRIYRNLLLAMARRRAGTHKHLFVKFSSTNIRFLSFIQAAFPAVPSIFLTRKFEDIISSFQQRPPAWLNQQNPQILKLFTGSDDANLPLIIESFLKIAASHAGNTLKVIDYSMLTPDNLPAILSYFNVTPGESQLELMKTQFAFDSKTEFNRKPFKP